VFLKRLGRGVIPTGLLILLLVAPVSGRVYDSASSEVDDTVWTFLGWTDPGSGAGDGGSPGGNQGPVSLARFHWLRDSGPSVDPPQSPLPPSRDAREDQAAEPTPEAGLARPVQASLDTVLAQLPVDVVLDLAQRAQRAADEARRALPTLAATGEQQAGDAETDGGAVTVATPTHLVLGATLIAVGAAAAATFAVFWMAGSSGSVGAAAASKGGAEMRRLLPYASPLFTRFGKDTVLGHPRREALYARILQEPGISLQALGEATGLSRTAVVHHLRLLEQQHLIVSRRVGRGRHYFENGGRYGHDQKEAYAVLQNDRSRAVAEAIRARPGMMQKTLCAQLAIPPSIAHWHVTRLTQANLVQVVRQGRTVAYFPGHAMPALDGRARALPASEPAPMPMAAPMQVAPA
jgi:DNA-binding transcriptional ArsR family regulator